MAEVSAASRALEIGRAPTIDLVLVELNGDPEGENHGIEDSAVDEDNDVGEVLIATSTV